MSRAESRRLERIYSRDLVLFFGIGPYYEQLRLRIGQDLFGMRPQKGIG
jgi:hypothetical protein